MIQKLPILVMLLLATTFAYSQCALDQTSEQYASNITPVDIGQSFTAECNGYLESFHIYPTQSGTFNAGTLKIFEGNTVSGTPIYEQEHPEMAYAVPFVFVITGNVELVENTKYTFQVTTNVNYYFDYRQRYTGGDAWVGTNKNNLMDLSFGIRITDTPIVLGTGDDILDNKFSLYPNPTSGIVHFTSETDYQIIDALGNIILEGKGTSTDLTDAPSGLYIVKTQGADAISTFSIMKQ